MENFIIKTYENWEGSLDKYLKVGDKVDEEMYEHFLNVLPPLVNRTNMLQVSEPYDYVDGKNTYTTFTKENGYWTYRGNCHKGETINRKNN